MDVVIKPTCSVDGLQQQVQQLFVNILVDVDLRCEEHGASVRYRQVLTADSIRQQLLRDFSDLWDY